MKKLISILLFLAMMLSIVPGLAEAPAYDGSEVTITFYNTMGSNLTPVLEAYIAEFEAMYPNIHVEYTSVGSYDDVRDQISTEITVGGQPNIAYCYPDHVALYNLAKAVRPLDAFIESDAGRQHRDHGPDRRAEGRLHRRLLQRRPAVWRRQDVHHALLQVHRGALLQQDLL